MLACCAVRDYSNKDGFSTICVILGRDLVHLLWLGFTCELTDQDFVLFKPFFCNNLLVLLFVVSSSLKSVPGSAQLLIVPGTSVLIMGFSLLGKGPFTESTPKKKMGACSAQSR
jgi:hypothetical protein